MADSRLILDDLAKFGRELPTTELPGFIGRLAEADAIARSRLNSPAPNARADEWLTVKQASELLHVSRSYLYHFEKHGLTFARKMGRKLLFSRRGIEQFLERSKPL